jgi:hypothetical protein
MTWDRVDEPVLRWIRDDWPLKLGERHQYTFDTRPPEPIPELDNLPSDELHESLLRLHEAELIDGLVAEAMSGSTTWTNLRLTSLGLVAIGEWPDLDLIASAVGIHDVLDALADAAPEEERSFLRRAAGTVGRLGDEIVRSTLSGIAGDLGKDVVE